MEDNNKKGKRGVIDASVILSFAVAIFAIFSLVMADISLSQRSHVSYAAPETLPSSFTFSIGDTITSIGGPNNEYSFEIPLYYVASSDTPIFCVEHNVPPEEGVYSTTEGTDSDITDYGLLYLLNNTSVNGISVTSATGEDANYVEGWVTQAAIWMYLYEKNGGASLDSSSPHYLHPDHVTAIKNSTKLMRTPKNGGNPQTIYQGTNLYNIISELVTNAQRAGENSYSVIKVKVDGPGTSKSSDEQFYFSEPVRVTASGALKHFNITLDGIEGAKAVRATGDEETRGTELVLGDEYTLTPENSVFYVRIPAEKVTKEVQTVSIGVTGTFEVLEGKYYTAASPNKQKVVTVKGSPKTLSAGDQVEFYGGEDTGMNKVQTIYFIGLIVLLCGVGIVYANAKPVQVKQ